MQLGRFAGPIYTIILIVECLFFLFLEWWMPRVDIDYVRAHWDQKRFIEVSATSESVTVWSYFHSFRNKDKFRLKTPESFDTIVLS